MRREVFLLCYLLVMAAILFIPVFRNIYSLFRYKMSFSKHDKRIIEAFCQNATYVCVAKPRTNIYISTGFFIVACLFATHSALFSLKISILKFIIILIFHTITLFLYVTCLYEKYIITNDAILIRSIFTKFSFFTVKLNTIKQYKLFSSPYYAIINGVSECLTILTEDKKKFVLFDFKNRDQFVYALETFTDSVKISES